MRNIGGHGHLLSKTKNPPKDFRTANVLGVKLDINI